MKNINKLKLIPIACAGAMFVLGIVLFAITNVIGDHVLAVVGCFVLAIGIARIVYGFLAYKKEADAKINITLGVLDAVWAILAIIFTGQATVYATLLGIWLLVGGVVEVATACKYIFDKVPFAGLFIDGGINLLFGVVLMINPFGGEVSSLTMFTAIYVILNAFTTVLITTFALKKPAGEVKAVDKKEEVKAEPEKKEVVIEEVDLEVKQEKPVVAKKTTTAKKPTAAKATTAKPAAAKTTATKKPTTTAKKTTTTKK